MLKPQDVVIAIKLLQGRDGVAPTYAELALALKMSPSEAHAGVRRGLESGLLRKPAEAPGRMPQPVRRALAEFLVSGVKYVWPAKPGSAVRGIPTCTSLGPVAAAMGVPEPDAPMVWRDPAGTVRGESLPPLYPKLPAVCSGDEWLHEWMALVDILRCRTGREAAQAIDLIQARLS